MSNYELVINLKDLKEYCERKIRGKADTWYSDSVALGKAILIVQKDIPLYPYPSDVNLLRDGKCPSCDCELNVYHHYCFRCGQKIDWS